MRNILILFTLIVIISCERKDKNDCKYWSRYYPVDSSLFISYKLNNVDYRYYEICENDNTGYHVGYSSLTKNGKHVLIHIYPFYFDDLQTNGPTGPVVIRRILTFYDTSLTKEFNSIDQRALSRLLHSNYKFTFPERVTPREIEVQDTAFLRGVSLSLSENNNIYSSDSLITHFKYNIDSLSKYLWSASYFNILKASSVCDIFKLIEGKFTTSIWNVNENKRTFIENGQFRILVNK